MDKIRNYYSKRKGQLKKPYQSSVFIPLIEGKDELSILLEVRANTLKRQPGEVCLPGGCCEKDEDRKDTAIRETVEELLIDPSLVEVIGAMDAIEGAGNDVLWPFVGILHDYRYTYSIDEVDHVFTVPLSYLKTHPPKSYNTSIITIPSEDFPYDKIPDGKNYHWRKRYRTIYFYEYNGYVIWGLTAQILKTFIDSIK